MQRSLRDDRDSHRLAWVVILIATLLMARTVAGAPIPPSPAAPLEVGEPFLSELEKNRMQTVLRIWSLLDGAERDRWIRAGQVRNGIVLH
jgi:hypothetical protein